MCYAPGPMSRALALVLLALIPVLPAVLPGAQTYLDNPSHLVEVRQLQEILAEDHWFSGWGRRANAGMAVNQVNAPLVWVAVAVVGGLTGGVAANAGGVLLANVGFALGARRLFRRLFDEDAAWAGAALVTIAPQDLYGFAGAAGGMWPHRLATGLLLAGLAEAFDPRPTPPGRLAAWLGLLAGCHTYAGLDAGVLVGLALGLALLRRRWAEAGRLALGSGVAAAITAPFWVPLLDPAVRPDFAGTVRFWTLVDHLAWLVLPLSPVRLNRFEHYQFLGGPLAFGWSVLLLVGLAAAWRHRAAVLPRLRPLATPPLLAGPLLLGLLCVVVMAIVPLTLTEAFGPNPWRHLSLVRVALGGLAGAGLVAAGLPFRSPLPPILFAAGAFTAFAGGVEMRLPVTPEARETHAQVRATWADLVAAAPAGRVYHQNTARGDGATELRRSQIGALLAYETDLPVVGTWYTISPVASEPHMRSANGGLFGSNPQRWFRAPEEFRARARAFNLGAIVVIEPDLAGFLARRPWARRVGAHGPFSAWVLDPGGGPTIECPERATCTDPVDARGRLELTLGAVPGGELGVRETWHPWWSARLDGEPVPVSREKGTGRIRVELPAFERPRRLVLRWVDPTRWTLWLTLAGGLVAAMSWRTGDQGPPRA